MGDAARAELSSDPHWAGPAHLLIEVLSVIRGKTLGGKLGLDRAQEAVAALPTLVIDYVEAAVLTGPMWELRATSPHTTRPMSPPPNTLAVGSSPAMAGF